MDINSAALIYFSPTGKTKKILDAVIKGLGVDENTQSINLTSPSIRDSKIPCIKEDIVIIGSPVYKSKIPTILYPFLSNLISNNKPAVLITVYGNVEKGIALNELYSITEKAGFKIIAAGSFIAEHSFSTDEVPVAKGRPSAEELKKAEEFGRSIKEKIYKIETSKVTAVKIPQRKLSFVDSILPENVVRMLTKTPVVDLNLCNQCGVCVKQCPTSAIDKDTLEVNESLCLRCFSCEKRCHKKARQFAYKKKFLTSRFFSAKNKNKNQPDIYL